MNSITIPSPIGWLRIAETNGRITEITYKPIWEENKGICTGILLMAKQQLEEYFDGQRKSFDLPLDFCGTEFNKKVLCALAEVPYGETISYGQLAEKCGSPKAARAVGTAMRKNPFVIVIPCHRVLPQSGKLGNYSAGGPANKDWLLTFEKQNSQIALF